MKKFFLVLTAVFALTATAFALEPSEAQCKTFKTNIMSYVRTEGYAPSLDSDGDIAFKNHGDQYWISVESYDDGYYVNLFTIDNCGSISTSKLLRAANDAMRSYKYARCYLLSDNSRVYIGYSWYCDNTADFKVMFSNALDVVSLTESKFVDLATE